MLTRPGEFFQEQVVHRYAGETRQLRTLARFLFGQDRQWSIRTAWFDVEFGRYDHSAAYTLFLDDSEGSNTQLVVPSTPASESFLFQQKRLPLAYEMHEWSRAAFYLWQRTNIEIESEFNPDFVEAGLLDFLRNQADDLEHQELADRLQEIPINPPHEDETTKTLRMALESLYESTLELVEEVLQSEDNMEFDPEVVHHDGARQILDLWADLTWYDPAFSASAEDE